ncbi:MAG: IMS domain-containing protein [Acidobacteria bacterium]|nr:IMS domain-containing protein [Acidobacteriota bacterium]
MSRRVLIPITLVLGLTLPLLGCGRSARQEERDATSIEAMLEQYLPLLARVYADGDIELLRPYAVEKELARMHALVQDLADQGRYLAPEFKSVTVEKTHVWNNSNAFVSTLEVWNVRLLVLGRDELLAEDLDKNYRVKYQLKRSKTGWRILFRAIQE